MNNQSEIVNFIWSVANLIRDSFKRGKYQDIILPLTVLRRLDYVMAAYPSSARGRPSQERGYLTRLAVSGDRLPSNNRRIVNSGRRY